MEDGTRWMSDRAETLREAYLKRLHAHRAALQDICRRNNWSFILHHTDKSPSDTLLQVVMRLRDEPVTKATAATGAATS